MTSYTKWQCASKSNLSFSSVRSKDAISNNSSFYSCCTYLSPKFLLPQLMTISSKCSNVIPLSFPENFSRPVSPFLNIVEHPILSYNPSKQSILVLRLRKLARLRPSGQADRAGTVSLDTRDETILQMPQLINCWLG